jgi:Tfp pilus assembly protein PilN
MKKLKEIHENEIKKLEDRYLILERKYEQQHINNDGNVILRSNSLLCQTLPNIGSALTSKPRATNVNSKINQVNNTKSLMDALESAADESSPQSQIIFLQNEVVMLKDQITDLNLKIYKFQNQQEDHDFLLKENKKLKSDIKDMESLYEKQIADLNKKTVDMNAEIEMANKQRLSVNKRHSVTNNKKSLSNYNENSETMKLKAEINFLQEKVQILTKEMENIKNLYENDIKYLKEQLRSSESIAVSAKISLATLAYEKDSEIIKYKNSLRKLKTRLNGMSNESDNSSNQNSILTGTFLKNFFK